MLVLGLLGIRTLLDFGLLGRPRRLAYRLLQVQIASFIVILQGKIILEFSGFVIDSDRRACILAFLGLNRVLLVI